MKALNHFTLSIASCLLAIGSASAAVYTWAPAGVNTNWSNASNWDSGSVPNNDTATNHQIIIGDGSNVTIGNYSVNNDASDLIVGNNVTLDPNWNFRFGSVTIGSNVVITTTGDGLTSLGNITTDSVLYLKSNAGDRGLRAMAVGSTLNLGINGAIISQTMETSVGSGINGKKYILTGELDLYATSASIGAGDYYWSERLLIGGKDIWNREQDMNNENAAFNYEASDFTNGTKITSGRSDGMGTNGNGNNLSGLILPDATAENLGSYYFKTTGEGVYIVYLAQNGAPIPEPATFTLGTLGFIGLLLRRRR